MRDFLIEIRPALLPAICAAAFVMAIVINAYLLGVNHGLKKLQQAPTLAANGMIHHPVYGDYPALVPYHDGMSLMPGQSAVTLRPDDLSKKYRQ